MKATTSASDLRDQINALRTAAGLPVSKALYGTSKDTLQIILNRAQRGEFPESFPTDIVKDYSAITDSETALIIANVCENNANAAVGPRRPKLLTRVRYLRQLAKILPSRYATITVPEGGH